MYYLLSYPRSGNHFLRYVIEFCTGHSTLGCLGNEKVDTEIFKRNDVKYLQHVSEPSLVRKAHFSSDIEELIRTSEDKEPKVIFLIRNPIESLFSHNKNNIKNKDINDFYVNLKFVENFKQNNKLIIYYENLNSENFKISLQKLNNFMNFNLEKYNELNLNFKKYKTDSLGSLIRKPIASNDNDYYKKYLKENNLYNQQKERLKQIHEHKYIKDFYGEF